MICIKVARKALYKLFKGGSVKLNVENIVGKEKSSKDLMRIFDNIIKGRFHGRRRNL